MYILAFVYSIEVHWYSFILLAEIYKKWKVKGHPLLRRPAP